MNNPNKVVLHCAASEDTPKDVKFSFEDCRNFHKNKRGWRDIGYHYYIERSGEVFEGRPINMAGAHEKSQNSQSIGVCYEGSHLPTLAQLDSILNLFRTFRSTYGFSEHDWYGHYNFKNKECPGFDMEVLKGIFRKLA